MKVNVPYCIPLVYELDANLKPIKHYYLASEEEVQKVIEGIKNQAIRK
jgi:2,3-bisphosphoglycerate-dependent phosphoglycerate mutase